MSLPERRYDVAHILATAYGHATGGVPLEEALHRAAHAEGHGLGTAVDSDPSVDSTGDLDRLARALTTQGYEPREEQDALILANCPFDRLAREHTELICGLNQSYVQGVVEGLGCAAVNACLEPTSGRCCVKARLRS